MASSVRLVTADELASIQAPASEGRWVTQSHSAALATVMSALDEAGRTISTSEYYVLRTGSPRFIGLLHLDLPINDDMHVVVAVQSSTDRSLPLGLFFGAIHAPTNILCFVSKIVSRKHTVNASEKYVRQVREGAASLHEKAAALAKQIEVLKEAAIGGDRGDSLILQAFEKGIISPNHLKKVVKGWRKPWHDSIQVQTKLALMLQLNASCCSWKGATAKALADSMRIYKFLVS